MNLTDSSRQPETFGIMHLIHLFRIITQVLSNFVAQVCIGVFIAHNFHRIVYPYRAVVVVRITL